MTRAKDIADERLANSEISKQEHQDILSGISSNDDFVKPSGLDNSRVMHQIGAVMQVGGGGGWPFAGKPPAENLRGAVPVRAETPERRR